MIIIEGMDNSGKSTLAVHLAKRFNFKVQESEGPPKSAEEINERIRGYNNLQDTVFVRHPVISNAIYAMFRPEGNPILPELTNEFYAGQHLIIYCDPMERGLASHVLKDHDTPEHIAMVTARRAELVDAYREWAIKHAHIIYRIGDDMDRVCDWVAYAPSA